MAASISLYALLQAQYAAQSPRQMCLTSYSLSNTKAGKVPFTSEIKEIIRVFLKDNVLFAAQFLGLTSHAEENTLVERLHAVLHNAN